MELRFYSTRQNCNQVTDSNSQPSLPQLVLQIYLRQWVFSEIYAEDARKDNFGDCRLAIADLRLHKTE
jgi:hypothetical protein